MVSPFGSSDIRPVDFSTGNVVVLVEDLWKQYSLGSINHGTLARDLQSWWAKIRGEEDPNLCVDKSLKRHGNQKQNINTKKQYDERFWALQDLSFKVSQGDILGIIGRNGAGKSTFLKILSQITAPTRGEIKVKGKVSSLLEVGTGFHPELTGRENVFLNGAILGMSKKEILLKFDEIVDFSGIENFIDTPVKRYSSGMYVKLAFAVAAHLEPEILVVDEVLAVGDAEFQKKCLGKMQAIRGEGRTILFVSHNMGSIKALCNTGIMLQEGQLAEIGSIDEVVKTYLGWGEEEKKPRIVFDESSDKDIQISEISVVNSSGHLSFNHPYDQPFYVNVKIRVYKRVSQVYLAAHIVDSDLQTIHFSRNYNFNDDGEKSLEPGPYSFSIEYPAPLLVPGSYCVSFHVVSSSPASIIDGVENVCRFEIYDSGSINAKKGYPWRGKISVPVDWRVL